MHPIIRTFLSPRTNVIRHLRTNQRFYRVIGGFGAIAMTTLVEPGLLGCSRRYHRWCSAVV